MRKVIPRPKFLHDASKLWSKPMKEVVAAYVEELESYIYGLESSVLMELCTKETGVDPNKPPHNVPCPRCFAWALEHCRNEPRPDGGTDRWPDTSLLLSEPHLERYDHYNDHPEYRVLSLGGSS